MQVYSLMTESIRRVEKGMEYESESNMNHCLST